MEIVILALLIIISLFYLLLLNSFKKIGRNFNNEKDSLNPNLNHFSVLVAAKNEEENIERLISSLQKLEYPDELFEVILINDNSTDKTLELMKNCCKGNTHFKIINADKKNIPGKKGALQAGFEVSEFEYIVTTDADCEVPVNWLTNINYTIEKGAEVVIGSTVYNNVRGFFQKYFLFEQLKSRFLSFSLANLGLPYTSIGGNFCFPRKLLQESKGYARFAQVLSGDDDLLIQFAISKGYKIKLCRELNNYVASHPPKTFGEYLKQKQRHTSTSNYYLFRNKLALGIWHTVNLGAFYSIFFIFSYPTAIYPFLVKVIMDLATIVYTEEYFGKRISFFSKIVYIILYELLIPVHYFSGTFGKVKWK